MKYFFRDPVTHVLKAWGFVETNEPGDLRRQEPEDFMLMPGRWWLPDQSGPWQPYP